MAVKNNPAKCVGRNVKLIRAGKIVEVHLYAVGEGPHFKGTWVGPDGKPWQTIVPFSELEGMLIES